MGLDGKEVWVVVRGENYVSVLDGTTYEEKTRIAVPNGRDNRDDVMIRRLERSGPAKPRQSCLCRNCGLLCISHGHGNGLMAIGWMACHFLELI